MFRGGVSFGGRIGTKCWVKENVVGLKIPLCEKQGNPSLAALSIGGLTNITKIHIYVIITLCPVKQSTVASKFKVSD